MQVRSVQQRGEVGSMFADYLKKWKREEAGVGRPPETDCDDVIAGRDLF